MRKYDPVAYVLMMLLGLFSLIAATILKANNDTANATFYKVMEYNDDKKQWGAT